MYQIIQNGTTLGLIERPTYVELLPNGSYGLCDAGHAQGIAYEGEVYHLEGRAELEGVETVSLVEADSGEIATQQAKQIQAAADDLTSTQLALCEVYEMLMGGTENG